MRKILSQWKISKYTVLELDAELPKKPYREYKIEGITYKPVRVYDLPRSIAIESDGDFEGKTVEFV